MTQNRTTVLQNEAGFTLLEIIAVMVIMSILAVVAVPKYFDLQEQARTKAMETAMAEAVGRVNGYFAKKVLGGTLPKDIDYEIDPETSQSALGTDLGDFKLATDDGGAPADPATFDPTTVCVGAPAAAPNGCIRLEITPKAESKALSGATLPPKIIARPGF